jgi:hypothetical protein
MKIGPILILILAIAILSCGGYLLFENWKTQIMSRPPTTPGEFTAKPMSAIEIKLTWKDLNNENGFILYRDGKTVEKLPANTTSYIDSGLRPATYFSYEIKAYNQIGESKTAKCSVKTFNPPIQIWLEKVGVHENGEECEAFRELWDILQGKQVTGEVQMGFAATDGVVSSQNHLPDKKYYELKQDEVILTNFLLFDTNDVGDNLKFFATAYEQDGGFKEQLIYEALNIATGAYIGKPTSLFLTLAGIDFTKIYADIFGAEDDWLGSYAVEWNSSNNWGVGDYADIQCKRGNGNVGLRLWVKVVCPLYDYSSN